MRLGGIGRRIGVLMGAFGRFRHRNNINQKCVWCLFGDPHPWHDDGTSNPDWEPDEPLQYLD